MENMLIINRVIIAVNKRNKLLGYLRKLNSGDTEATSVKIFHTHKEKPINLFFTRSGTVDSFLVYAGYGKAGSKRKVVLGSATIVSLQKSGFMSVGNRESKECVAINIYAKEDALYFKELQDILLSLVRLSTQDLIITSAAMLIELKPENQNIINYEVLMLPNNPLGSSTAKKATDSAVNTKPQYVCHSKNNNSIVAESERSERYMQEKRNMLEALKRMHNTDSIKSYNIESELVVASSMLESDLEKPLKRWKKILKTKPIEVFDDTFLRVGHVVDFYIREVFIGAYRGASTRLTTRYELVAKYSLNESIASTGQKDTIISGLVFKALHNAHTEYKQRKSENLDISHLESLLEENQKISDQKEDKDLIGIIAEALREIGDTSKISVNRNPKLDVTEDLFCKKTKINNKKDNNTTQPYQTPHYASIASVIHPTVTILGKSDGKYMIKEIIEEANKTKSFPYTLDYNNSCVITISDSLFNILECKNKLEDTLKVKKVIDAGIFNLEHTGNLVLKKMFNISSLIIYYSPSKNLYALIGA